MYHKAPTNLTTGHVMKNQDAIAFMLGGNAWFTLKSLKTSADFSYGIVDSYNYEGTGMNRKKVYNPALKFVYLFIGANQAVQGKSYAYMGWMRQNKEGRWCYNFGTAKSKLDANHPGEKAFSFVFNRLIDGVNLPQLEVWHQGVCACCKKKLKLAESIELGFGPVCMKRRAEALEQLREYVAKRRDVANTQLNNSTNRFDTTGMIGKVLGEIPKQPTSGNSQGNLFNNLPDHSTGVKRK